MTEQLFGRILGDTPVFGETEPPTDAGSRWRRATDVVGLAATGVGLLAAAPRETRRLEAEVDRLERMVPADLSDLDDARLESLLLLSRDLAVHAWVLGCWGGMFSTSAVTAAEKLAGGRELPTPGADLASGRLIQSVRRLAGRARNDAAACVILAQDPVDLGALEREAPEFFRDLVGQLALVGHRGPAECEMESPSLSDDPQRFANQVGRAFRAPESEQTTPSGSLPLLARPAARLVVRHMKDREVRRDRVVRAIWVLRALLRERGRRLVAEGVLQRESDIFHLTVDEAARLPVAPADLVAGRRAERERLASIDVPSVIHGGWEPVVLSAGADDAEIAGIGVSPGKVRGLVRIVDPVTIDDLEPGEILVASVTDVGYTAAFAYAGAVVTDLGGSMSHAAVVAREFAVPCVVDTREATRNLRTGDLVEVDGASGTVTVIQRAHQNSQQGATA
jgi:phosphohistidine swiveling domain-containing protein